MKLRKRRILGQIAALLGLLASACGGAVVGPPLVGDGRATTVRSLDVTLQVPAGFSQKKETVWTLDSGGARHAMLWVQRQDLPKEGVDSYVEKLARDLGKQGTAGVTRREKIELDDLDGHYLEAATVVGRQASSAIQVIVGAEDGLYMLSIVATAATMKRNKKAFEQCARSLRVPRR